MSLRLTFSTAARILRQLRHDRRTIAMILVVPTVLLTLLRYLYDNNPMLFDRVGLIMLGVFPLVIMFLLTSVAMLRERTSGTLERLLTTPIGKVDILLGYGIAFAVAAAVQATVVSALAFWLLGLDTLGPAWLVGVLAVGNAVLGMALGLLVSAFANSEFQAVQFMPAVVLPQVLLCGLLQPRDQMAGWMQAISDVLPMSYAVQALTELGQNTEPTGIMWRDLGIIIGCVAVALLLGAATLRRRTA
ncbi:ABC transporter permease [Dactylosporangium sp. AC04546]|uniref:ABC transporter permease n=1 Tax=Dactylosporangium sp. AC04546 TaxID=2862460 RepID=UPI001EDEFB96|nr:ABC transporter permease [Dactylosporangium sp. AC04546]WVK82078.1 ABC transporter permease [Dactylosporangium sp. AC04546]